MAKETTKEKTLLEKALAHKVKRQGKKPVNKEELEVYVAYFNGEIDTSQACFTLNVTQSTFRGNSGAVLRDAIIQEKVASVEFID